MIVPEYRLNGCSYYKAVREKGKNVTWKLKRIGNTVIEKRGKVIKIRQSFCKKLKKPVHG